MPICTNCRCGFENDLAQCPRCGTQKPPARITGRSFLNAEPYSPNWSECGLPYKLFGFAAFGYYLVAIGAVLGVIYSTFLGLNLVTDNQDDTFPLGMTQLLNALLQLGGACLSWATALGFRFLRGIIRTA